MKKFISLFIVIVLSYSCETPCGEASTGPPYFRVEIVDSITNENVFSNGMYSQNQLSVVTNSNQSDYSFISENNMNIISISPAWTEGTYTTLIKLNDEITIPIETKIYKSSSRCYTNYFIEKINILNYQYVIDTSTGIYKIKI